MLLLYFVELPVNFEVCGLADDALAVFTVAGRTLLRGLALGCLGLFGLLLLLQLDGLLVQDVFLVYELLVELVVAVVAPHFLAEGSRRGILGRVRRPLLAFLVSIGLEVAHCRLRRLELLPRRALLPYTQRIILLYLTEIELKAALVLYLRLRLVGLHLVLLHQEVVVGLLDAKIRHGIVVILGVLVLVDVPGLVLVLLAQRTVGLDVLSLFELAVTLLVVVISHREGLRLVQFHVVAV